MSTSFADIALQPGALEKWENEGGTLGKAGQERRAGLRDVMSGSTKTSANKRQHWPLSAVSVLALVCGLPEKANADESKRDDGGFTLVFENDLFSSTANDRNYTSGLKAAYLTPAGREPRWARAIADLLPGYEARLDTRFEFEIGQLTFTPRDLTLETPNPNDRPYAGLTYGSIGLVSWTGENTLDQAQIVAGLVGPSSQAGNAQRWLHRQIDGAVQPQGWESEIADRFAGELRLQRTHRSTLTGTGDGFQIDLAPHYGVSLGNLTTSVSLGVGARSGWNLPVDFGPPRVSPSLPGSGYFITDRDFGWYAFGGVQARYVAYSLVLDERSAYGAKITRTPLVADAQLGLAVYAGDIRIAYTQVWRSQEFQSQTSNYSEFGAISLSWRH